MVEKMVEKMVKKIVERRQFEVAAICFVVVEGKGGYNGVDFILF